MPIILLCMIIFFIWLRHETGKTERSQKKQADTFWEREHKSNFSRSADINQLDYIILPLDSLPFQNTDDTTLNEIQNKIYDLSEKKILNLTGYSNTDLKLSYGPNNLAKLSSYDHNFTLLARTLQQWAEYLYQQKQTNSAKNILEYSISCKTDVSKSYLLLASIYHSEGSYTKIKELKSTVESLNSIMKDYIIDELNALLNH